MTLLKTVGHEQNTAPCGKRMTGVLSDNSIVCAVFDLNQTGVTGDGGDNTGQAKVYFYHSSDRVTWTLKATRVDVSALGSVPVCSMAIDASNNIHFVYRTNTGAVVYFKVTYAAGPTYTMGSSEQIVTFPGTSGATDIQYTRLDLDIPGTSVINPFVAGILNDARSATKRVDLKTWIRNNSAAWVAQTSQALLTGDSALGYADDVSVSANQTAIAADNFAYIAVSAQRISSTKKDFGGLVYMYKTLITTGVTSRVDKIIDGYGAGYGDLYRKYWLFNISDRRWVLTGVIANSPWQAYTQVFDWNTTTNVMTTFIPPTISSGNGFVANTFSRLSWCTVTYSRGTNTIAFFGIGNTGSPPVTRLFCFAAKLDLTTQKCTYQTGNQQYTQNYAPSGAPPSAVWGGAHPRSTVSGQYSDIMAFWWKAGTTAVYRVEHVPKRQALAPTLVKPAAASVQTTDRPTLQATVQYTGNYAPYRVKQLWQLATDSGFTTNARIVTEPDTDFQRYDSAPVVASEVVDAPGELNQGTWYVRSRTIDEYGWLGSYSAGQSFSVSHPPVGGSLAPRSNNLVLYGAFGTVNFTWAFTDASPYDFQTAYRIVVERQDDASVVVDSGKIAATLPLGNNAGQGTVNLPTTAKDVPLRWRVYLWDSDDVMGNPSAYETFYVTDPPAPTITAPTDGAVLTTGAPVIAWSPGLAGGKTQTAYRVLITTGAQTTYDTGWASGASTTLSVPSGLLRNGTSYTLTVGIQDNLGLDASVQAQFSTAWTPPASPTTLAVDPTQFDSRGFMYVTLNPVGFDPDFISFNLYRRALGATDWELITQWTAPNSAYLVYQDFLAGANLTYQYAVTQTVERFGDIIESNFSTPVTLKSSSTTYWLIHPTNPAEKSIPLYLVNSDDPTEEFEQETYQLLGRGRKTEYGDRLGYTGTLSAHLRDRLITGRERTNFVLNPSVTKKSSDSSLPSRFTTYTSGTVASILPTMEAPGVPSVTGKLNVCRLDIQDEGPATSAQAGIKTTVSIRDIRVEPLWNGSAYVSVWVQEAVDASHGTRMRLRALDAAAAQLSDSGYLAPTLLETNTYGWKRYGMTVSLGITATDVEVSIGVGGNGSGSTADQVLFLTGMQLETGTHSPYFDGNQFGGEWIAGQDDSASRTNGSYTARQQNKALSTLKNERTYIWLRNPFGDIWKVAPGNIGGGRIAGVGIAEFSDISIPYQEVDL